MKVAAAINGSIVSTKSALYALHYAKELGYDLVLVHLKNRKDSIEEVENSIKTIMEIGQKFNIETSVQILNEDTDNMIKKYLHEVRIDTLFCSTRRYKEYYTNSFSERLSKMDIPVNLAVVRVVDLSHNDSLGSIALPIKEAKLSVKKFSFLSAMAKAYSSKAEIFSITTMSKNKMVHIDMAHAKQMLEDINFKLRHYLSLSKLIGFNITIKHEFSMNEENSILEHIARSEHQLVIIGAERLSFFSKFLGKEPIEKLLQNASVNTIAFYPRK